MQFDIEYLIAVAKKAGLAIMEIYETTDSIEIQSKTDNSPLTNADIAAHETIISEEVANSTREPDTVPSYSVNHFNDFSLDLLKTDTLNPFFDKCPAIG